MFYKLTTVVIWSFFTLQSLFCQGCQLSSVRFVIRHSHTYFSMEGEEEVEDKKATSGISERANQIRNELLPKISEKKYESVYNNFLKWLDRNDIAFSYDEDTLLAYFGELSDVVQPTTLWSYLSMLKSTIAKHHNIELPNYYNLEKFLKRKNEG